MHYDRVVLAAAPDQQTLFLYVCHVIGLGWRGVLNKVLCISRFLGALVKLLLYKTKLFMYTIVAIKRRLSVISFVSNKEQMMRLTTNEEYTDDDDDDIASDSENCCICFEKISLQSPSLILPCVHNTSVHMDCVWDWVCCNACGDPDSGLYHISCPICRKTKTTQLVSHCDSYSTHPIRRHTLL